MLIRSRKRALDTINVRVGSRSHTESRSLRHCWRRVIGTAYADFQVNLPGCGPNLLVSSILSIDARTEDSSYPNLLLAKERERYGF